MDTDECKCAFKYLKIIFGIFFDHQLLPLAVYSNLLDLSAFLKGLENGSIVSRGG